MAAVMDEARSALSGESEKPKKEVHEMRIRRTATPGKHIIEHHHTHPAHHPMTEHVSHNDDALAEHVLQHMGTPNPGEAEADAGQSGIPNAAAAAGAPAGAAPPAPVAGVGV